MAENSAVERKPKSVEFADMPENTDITATRNEYIFKPPGAVRDFLEGLLVDKKDAPLIYLMFNMVVTLVPFACLVWYTDSHLVGLAYMLFNFAVFYMRFYLMLHFSTHRKIFAEGSILNYIPEYVLCPIMGLPPGLYYLHHVVMHHKENNVFPSDLSSTASFQRDKFYHFLYYWMRFACAVWAELPYWAFYRKRYGLFAQSVFSLTFYIVVTYYLYTSVGIIPAFYCWSLPMSFAMFILMYGNWSQHIFVDPDHHLDNYHLTYNCMNHADNQKSFNDGYHLIHHIYPYLHWTELPVRFMDMLKEHQEKGALTFKGQHFFSIGLLTFTGQLDELADSIVQLGPEKKTKQELIDYLTLCLQPCDYTKTRKRWYDWY